MLLRVGCIPTPPFIFRCSDVHDNQKPPGFAIEELLFLSQRFSRWLNECVSIEFKIFNSSGHVNKNGTWSGVMGGLQRDEIDIALHRTSLTNYRFNGFDVAQPVILVDYPGYLIHLTTLDFVQIQMFHSFTISVWIAWISLLFLICGLFPFVELGPSASLGNLCLSFLKFLFYVPFQQKSWKLWNSAFGCQLLITVWTSAALIGLVWFRSVFVRNLSPDLRMKVPFETVEDLARLVHTGKYNVYSRSGSPEAKALMGNDDHWRPLRKVLQRQNDSHILSGGVNNVENAVQYVKSHRGIVHPLSHMVSLTVAKDNNKLAALPDIGSPPYFRSFYMQKNSNISILASRVASELIEYGFAIRFRRKYGIDVLKSATKPATWLPASLVQFQLCLEYLEGFFGVSLLSFGSEILLSKLRANL